VTAKRLVLVLAAVIVATALSEMALRLCGCRSSPLLYEYQSAPFLCANPYWGVWHFANDVVEHRRSCFSARYETNEYGMKNGPVRTGTRRIALLGDSFVEGFGLDNDRTAAHRLEELLGPPYQVLNFGVSGYFSTIDEVALFDNFAKFFAPEVAVLFFVSYNDLEDLLGARQAKLIDRDLRLIYPRARSLEEVASVVTRQTTQPFAATTPHGLCIRQVLDLAWKVMGQQLQMWMNLRWDARHEIARPYLVDEDADMRRAWAIVEASLRHLTDVAREQGTALVVVSVADPYQIDTNWARLVSLREPTPLVPSHPNEHLGAICKRLGIRHYDMLPEVQRYVREHDLSFPLLSFRCDRHYDVEGQELMARLVFAYLKREGLIGVRGATTPAPAGGSHATSPDGSRRP
jgi:hypothetical protein